jgi:hypothetical protein
MIDEFLQCGDVLRGDLLVIGLCECRQGREHERAFLDGADDVAFFDNGGGGALGIGPWLEPDHEMIRYRGAEQGDCLLACGGIGGDVLLETQERILEFRLNDAHALASREFFRCIRPLL